MMTAVLRTIAVLSILVLAGPLSAAERPKLTVLQIESFELTNAPVEEMKGAGGGKVVVFGSEKSKAVTEIELPSGWYEAVLYVWAEDEESDCTYLMIEADDFNAGVAEMPVIPWDKKQIAPCTPIQFKFEGPLRPRQIKLWTNETGVKLDRLEIKR